MTASSARPGARSSGRAFGDGVDCRHDAGSAGTTAGTASADASAGSATSRGSTNHPAKWC
jgi:hypothetical protein